MIDMLFIPALVLFGFGWIARCCCVSTIGCAPCTGGVAAAEYQVEISGMANDSCTDCASIDGTYIVPMAPLGDDCQGQITLSPVYCARNYLRLTFAKISPTSYFYIVKHGRNVGDDSDIHSLWREEETTAQDCLAFNNFQLNDFTSNPAFFGFTPCDISGATCTVTAV